MRNGNSSTGAKHGLVVCPEINSLSTCNDNNVSVLEDGLMLRRDRVGSTLFQTKEESNQANGGACAPIF